MFEIHEKLHFIKKDHHISRKSLKIYIYIVYFNERYF